MALTVSSSGTQSATLDTEHSLATTSTAGIYQLLVDTNAMVNGDITELVCKANVLNAGTERILFKQIYSHIQAEPIKISVPVSVPQTSTWTLQQTDGTGRSYPWALLKLA
jgi:hypothetical protein